MITTTLGTGKQVAVFVVIDHRSATCVGLHAAERARALKRWSRSAKG